MVAPSSQRWNDPAFISSLQPWREFFPFFVVLVELIRETKLVSMEDRQAVA